MKLRYCQKAFVSILAWLLILAATGISQADALAGSKGHVHFPVFFAPDTTGGCGKRYQNYVAAGGHSAYAMTPFNWATEYTICGSYLNAPSQQAAESMALKSCQTAQKKYKVQTAGTCGIAASK
jgi:hypothetical protein